MWLISTEQSMSVKPVSHTQRPVQGGQTIVMINRVKGLKVNNYNFGYHLEYRAVTTG